MDHNAVAATATPRAKVGDAVRFRSGGLEFAGKVVEDRATHLLVQLVGEPQTFREIDPEAITQITSGQPAGKAPPR